MQSPPTEVPELPDLDPGLRLLESDTGTTGALHSLVVDHVLRDGGDAYWVDSRGRARTRPLARLAPSRRVLERIDVARGFTAFQHYALVEALAEREADPALVVLPAIDYPYRADDLRGDEGREMLVRAIATVAGVARRRDCPVLVTRVGDDEFATPVERAARGTIRVAETDHGPRFVGREFETLVYPRAEGSVQTTFAFWERVLRARAREHAQAAAIDAPTPEVTVDGTH